MFEGCPGSTIPDGAGGASNRMMMGGGGGGGGGRRAQEARPQGSSWALIQRAAGLFRPYRWAFVALMVLLATTSTFDLVAVRLLGSMVDEMSATGEASALDRLLVIFIALVIGSSLLGVVQSYTNQVIGQGVMLRLRSDLHDHLQRLSARFYTQNRTGEILSRISTDVNAVQQSVTGTFTDFLSNLLTLTIAFALMFSIEWKLALATIAFLPFWVYPTMRVGRHMRDLMRAWHQETAAMSSHLEETLSVSGALLVRSFGRQELYEFPETLNNVVEIAIDIRMVEFDRGDNRIVRGIMEKFWALVEKCGVIFIPLDHKKIPLSDPEIQAEIDWDPADHEPGILSAPVQNPGDNRGRGRLAVGAAYDHIAFAFHGEDSEGLGHGKVGNLPAGEFDGFRVEPGNYVPHNHEIRRGVKVFSLVSFHDRDFQVPQEVAHGRVDVLV